MALIFKRFISTKPISTETRSIAEKLLAKYQGNPLIHSQLLDPNQLQRLSLTLNRPHLYAANTSLLENPPLDGTPLPPGYHLAYFTPAVLPANLNPDGTDPVFSPEQPFTRRMWAGGELHWRKDNLLRVGDIVTETTRLVSAEGKVARGGEEMIVVGVEKRFENKGGVCLVDRRDWVFRPGVVAFSSFSSSPVVYDDKVVEFRLPEGSGVDVRIRDFCQSAVDLFRFSALTFNAHKIHYSRPWCREVEGHKGVVVHGPLNLINMLDFWRDTRDDGSEEVPRSIRYRATAPFYAEERYRALLGEGETGVSRIRLWGNDGKGEVRVGMMGDVVGFER